MAKGESAAVAEKVEKKGREKKEPYFMGCIEPCPQQVIHLAGFDFPLFTNPVKPERKGNDYIMRMQSPQPGKIMNLSQKDIDRIKAAAKKKVVKWSNSSRSRGQVWSVETPGYYEDETDEPISKFVYLAPLSQVSALEILNGTVKVPTLYEQENVAG